MGAWKASGGGTTAPGPSEVPATISNLGAGAIVFLQFRRDEGGAKGVIQKVNSTGREGINLAIRTQLPIWTCSLHLRR